MKTTKNYATFIRLSMSPFTEEGNSAAMASTIERIAWGQVKHHTNLSPWRLRESLELMTPPLSEGDISCESHICALHFFNDFAISFRRKGHLIMP